MYNICVCVYQKECDDLTQNSLHVCMHARMRVCFCMPLTCVCACICADSVYKGRSQKTPEDHCTIYAYAFMYVCMYACIYVCVLIWKYACIYADWICRAMPKRERRSVHNVWSANTRSWTIEGCVGERSGAGIAYIARVCTCVCVYVCIYVCMYTRGWMMQGFVS